MSSEKKPHKPLTLANGFLYFEGLVQVRRSSPLGLTEGYIGPMNEKSMSKQEAKQLIARSKAYLKKALVSKQSALDALVRAGLVTKSGRPTKLYASSLKSNSSKP